jgi:hypothetical protein
VVDVGALFPKDMKVLGMLVAAEGGVKVVVIGNWFFIPFMKISISDPGPYF